MFGTTFMSQGLNGTIGKLMGRVTIQTIELIGSQSLNYPRIFESAVHRLDGSGLLNLEEGL